MKESILRVKAKEFSLHVITVCDEIGTRKNRGPLVNQIIRSSTSIGANIHEAAYGSSPADFICKLQISLKECYETEYWIEIAQKASIISDDVAKTVLHDCGSIRRILISSINTAKENAK